MFRGPVGDEKFIGSKYSNPVSNYQWIWIELIRIFKNVLFYGASSCDAYYFIGKYKEGITYDRRSKVGCYSCCSGYFYHQF